VGYLVGGIQLLEIVIMEDDDADPPSLTARNRRAAGRRFGCGSMRLPLWLLVFCKVLGWVDA
jgi:hypothetical protein